MGHAQQASAKSVRTIVKSNLVVPTKSGVQQSEGAGSQHAFEDDIQFEIAVTSTGLRAFVAFTDMAAARRFYRDQLVGYVVLSAPSLCRIVDKKVNRPQETTGDSGIKGIIINPADESIYLLSIDEISEISRLGA